MELSDPPTVNDSDHERGLILELASKSAPYERLTFTYGESKIKGGSITNTMTHHFYGTFYLDRSSKPLPTIFDLPHG